MLKGLKSVNLKIIQMYHFRLKWKIYESLSKFLSVSYLMKTADVIMIFFSSHNTTDHT